MELNETSIGLLNILVMVASAIWMFAWGIGGAEKAIPLIVFAASFSFTVVFFPDWFGRKE